MNENLYSRNQIILFEIVFIISQQMNIIEGEKENRCHHITKIAYNA